jgi:hypothetical protein
LPVLPASLASSPPKCLSHMSLVPQAHPLNLLYPILATRRPAMRAPSGTPSTSRTPRRSCTLGEHSLCFSFCPHPVLSTYCPLLSALCSLFASLCPLLSAIVSALCPLSALCSRCL